MTKKDQLAAAVGDLKAFRICGPSDDPDQQWGDAIRYRHLLVQLKRLAAPLLPDAEASRLRELNVDVNDISSVWAAAAEVDALLPDIEAALDRSHDGAYAAGASAWIIQPELIERLADAHSVKLDVAFLVQMCREINSCFAHGNLVATMLLMRAVLNYVPPLFGHETFAQVVANIGRSLKEGFDQLENGLRKVADYQTHRRIGPVELYPSPAQVEPYKPPFELLLQQVAIRVLAE